MAQDTIKCYDSPSDVVQALAEDFIAFTNEEINRTETCVVGITGGTVINGLLELLDGPSETGIGFALSIERLLLALEEEGIELDIEENLDLFIVTMGDQADRYAVKLLNHLRHNGIKADKDYLQRKIKGQMKQADRLGAKFTIVIGDQELENNKIDVKNMTTGESETIELDALVEYFKK